MPRPFFFLPFFTLAIATAGCLSTGQEPRDLPFVIATDAPSHPENPDAAPACSSLPDELAQEPDNATPAPCPVPSR